MCMRLRFLALFPILAFAIVADAQTQTQAPLPTSISGRVLRAGGGDPLKKAVVTLRAVGTAQNNPPGGDLNAVFQQQQGRQQNRNQSVTTRDDGTFVFNNVAPGQYRVSVERDGYINQEYGQRSFNGTGTVITLGAGQRLNSIDFQMSPAGTIAGKILDEDGEPVTGIQVQALSYQYRNGVPTLMPSRQVQTNDLGEYRLYWLSPGDYYVSALPNPRRGQVAVEGAYAPSYFPGGIDPERAAPVGLAAAAEVRGIDFILRPVATVKVSGRVIMPTPTTSTAPPAPAIGQRGGGGRAQGLLRGAAAPQVMLVPSNVRPGGGAIVRAIQGGGRGNVAADGTFEISNVIPGSYTVIAIQNQENRLFMANARVEVADADVGNITLALRPGVDVPGQIFIEGQTTPPPQFSMERVRVTLNSAEQLPIGNANAQVKADGSFVFPNVATIGYRVNIGGLPAGAYLLAGRYGGADALNGPLQISDQNLPLQLQIGFTPGRVDGTVSDTRDQAFAGAMCVLIPSARNRIDLYKTATTDQYGKFSFANVPPGDYKLFAWEDIPQGAYLDSVYLGRFEERGRAIRVEKSGSVTMQIRVIPAN